MKPILARFLILIILLSIIAIFFQGCISTKQRGRNLVRRGWAKMERGMALDPDLADSIRKVRTVTIDIPAKKDSGAVKMTIDTARFARTMKSYDSLRHKLDSLQGIPKTTSAIGAATQEFIDADNRQITKIQTIFKTAFVRDSTYLYHVDSITTLSISTKKGMITSWKITTAATTVKKKIDTVDINVDGRQIGDHFWQDQFFWWFIICSLIIILLTVVIIALLKKR